MFFLPAADAHAQSGPAQPTLYLHIPSKMIAGQTYQGIAVSSEPAGLSAAGERTVHLASGSPAIMLQQTVVEIPVGKNHAVFTMRAVQDGMVEVHAAYGGLVGQAHGTVYSQATGPQKLDIITPGGLTSASDLPALVYLVDANGYPTRAPAGGVDVRLVGGGLVEAPRSVAIPAGSAQALVPLRVSGTGHVSAAAPGLVGDTEYLTYDRDSMHVRLEVAPDIVLPGGRVYYSVWLERDPVSSGSDLAQDGSGTEAARPGAAAAAATADARALPYHPPRAIAAELQTTNTDVLRLTEHHPSSKKDGQRSAITLQGGRASGVLYAGHEVYSDVRPASSLHAAGRTSPAGPSDGGIALLTVSVPGYGVASAHVCVGTVVTSDTEVSAYDTNSTAITRDSAGDFHVVSSSSDSDGSSGADGRGAGGRDNSTSTNRSCGSDTETWSAYVDRVVGASVGAITQDADTGGATIGFPREVYGPPEPNHVRLFMQPSTVTPVPPHSGTHGVVGFYHTESGESEWTVDVDGDLTVTTSTEYERITPLRISYESMTVTATSAPGSERGGGGIDVRPHHVAHPTFHTNAHAFPILANLEGEYGVQAASGGRVSNATLSVVHPYETAYHLRVTELPPRGQAGEEQPLFLVGLADDAGRIIDVLEEFGEPRTVRASFGDLSAPSAARVMVRDAELGAYNTAVISGPVPDAGGTGVVITLEGWPPASGPYENVTMPVDAPVRMEMDVPRMVHVGEHFPVTTHTVDSMGNPVALVGGSERRDTGFATAEDGTGLVRAAGERHLSSLYGVGGAVQREVVAFLNLMRIDVDGGHHAPGPDGEPVPRDVKAGEPFEIRAGTIAVPRSQQAEGRQHGPFGGMLGGPDPGGIDLGGIDPGLNAALAGLGLSSGPVPVPGVEYELVAPPGWPVDEPSPGVFVVTPADEGEFIIVIRGHKEGFDSPPAVVYVSSEMSVPLTVDAVVPSQDGRVSVPFTLQNGTTFETPFHTVLSGPGDMSFSFPESFAGGYGLVDTAYEGGTLLPDGSVRISAYDHSVNVTAVYDRQVEIVVLGTGSTGSGAYQYGQTVVASASPGRVIPFLIPERVAYWQGVPGTGGVLPTDEVISFRAESDAVIEPVFEPDLTRLYFVIAGGAAAGGYLAYRKFGPAVSYRIGDLADSVRGGGDGDGDEVDDADEDADGATDAPEDADGHDPSGEYNAGASPDGYDETAYRDAGGAAEPGSEARAPGAPEGGRG